MYILPPASNRALPGIIEFVECCLQYTTSFTSSIHCDLQDDATLWLPFASGYSP